MYNSYLEEIMEMSAPEREELKEGLLRHGDDEELRLLAQIEAEEAKCHCNKGSYYLL
jgi:hypothetical protein